MFSLWYIWKTRHDDYMERDPLIVNLKTLLLPTFPELSLVKMMKSDASYTINKSKIYLCTEHNGQQYDDNMLIYVILHELAHVLTREIGHGPEFMAKFDSLLTRGTVARLYDPLKPRIQNYCKN